MCMRRVDISSNLIYLYFNAKLCNLTCLIACDKGTYGLDCMQNCSFKCVNGLCNNVDGSCICANGKKGSSDCNDGTLLKYCSYVVLVYKVKSL